MVAATEVTVILPPLGLTPLLAAPPAMRLSVAEAMLTFPPADRALRMRSSSRPACAAVNPSPSASALTSVAVVPALPVPR